MPSADELSDTIQAALTLVGLDAATIERSPSSTIVPPRLRIDTAGERAMSLFGELGASTVDRKLDLHGTIGEGGMGVVHLGTQRVLGREVAVKSLKEEHKSEHSVLKLLREAWVTGGLEHPNVVPVYDIALDGDGSPLIVLKKIEGTDWATLMHDARTVRDRFGESDLLEWNLRTLMQVCNAVRFAHSRRVLHRDLKPENVMIGQFGEVYLVDWGIAVALEDDGSGRLPLASEATEMAGTPLYMAPEMLGGSTSRLSERTDLYLLGAILYEIVAGRPPHVGDAFMEIVSSIVLSEPDIPESVPEELARIVRRAMDPDPDARFENAEQVRLAVQAFLQHRDAARLADRAHERARELIAMLEADGGSDPEHREAVYHLFGECRFGFRHALEVWPGNDAARRALDRTIEAMVEHELGLGEPEAARALLGEMEAVPDGLAERVSEARQKKLAEEAQLRRLRHDLDPARGRRTRSFIAMVMGLVWTFTPLAGQLLYGEGVSTEPPWWAPIAVSLAFIALLSGFGVWARDSMMGTAINRRLGLAAVLSVSLHLVARLVSLGTGDTALQTLHQQFLVWSGIVIMLAAAVDWRLLLAAGGYLAAYAVTPLVGVNHALWVLSAANGVLLINSVLLWWQPKEDIEAARKGIRERRAERRRWLEEHFGRRARDQEP